MSQQLQLYAVSAPGFNGLDTQDSPTDLSTGFALTAVNCVIDQYGRIGARKGWSALHTTNATLGTGDVKALGELVTAAGVSYKVACGSNALFLLDTTGLTLTQLTYGGGGSVPTITDSHWSIAPLNGCLYFFQSGHEPLVFDPAVSATTYRRVSEKAGYAGTVPQGNVVLAAYGRLWVADTTTNKTTLYFSDSLAGQVWSTGTSGSLDLTTVWPKGGDSVVGLAAHNGFLFIFGQRSFIVYQGPTNPTTMSLQDAIPGVGCVARDSIQNIGTDVVFLSDTGVRSVERLVQEKSAPQKDLSKNVRTDLLLALSLETVKNIKSGYNAFEGFYLISFPTLKTVYCLDLKQVLQDGFARVTTWDSLLPTSFFYLRSEMTLLIGRAGFVGKYSGYSDGGSSYRFQYYTNHSDLGDQGVTSILKGIRAVIIGGAGQTMTIKWGYDFSSNYKSQAIQIPVQGVAYYGVSEYNTTGVEYSTGLSIQSPKAYPTGSGKVVQLGFEADINGSALSIQRIEIQAKNGKIV